MKRPPALATEQQTNSKAIMRRLLGYVSKRCTTSIKHAYSPSGTYFQQSIDTDLVTGQNLHKIAPRRVHHMGENVAEPKKLTQLKRTSNYKAV